MKHKLKFKVIDASVNLVYYSCEKCGRKCCICLDHPETFHLIVDRDDCKSTCEDFNHAWEYDGFTACNTGDYIILKCLRCSRKAKITIGRLINSKYCETL